jgi:putative selenate reductase
MDKLGVSDIESYILKAYGNAEQALENIASGGVNTSGTEAAAVDALRKTLENGVEFRKVAGAQEEPLANEIFEKWLSEVKLLNTKTYVDEVTTQARYTLEKNSNPPRKVGTTLELFDCLTCDKCIPVCPNDANFALNIPQGETEILEFENNKSGWSVKTKNSLKLEKKYQIANFADFCNECGNCDIFCPEDGGPFLLKPRFFGSLETFQEFSHRDGFYLERVETAEQVSTVYSRFDGKEYRVSETGNTVNYSGPDFDIQFSKNDPANTISGEAKSRVSFLNYEIMQMMRTSYENTSRHTSG